MRAGVLSSLLTACLCWAGCAAPPSCPEPKTATADPRVGSSAPGTIAGAGSSPALSGAYQVVELRQGKSVTSFDDAFLSAAPSCYAARLLWAFDKGSLSISMETLCDSSSAERTVDLCRAALEVAVVWGADAFRVPASVKALGYVDRYTLGFEPLPNGMKRTRNRISRSCSVSASAATMRISNEGGALILSSPEGDLVLKKLDDPAVDWDREAQRRYEERHGTK